MRTIMLYKTTTEDDSMSVRRENPLVGVLVMGEFPCGYCGREFDTEGKPCIISVPDETGLLGHMPFCSDRCRAEIIHRSNTDGGTWKVMRKAKNSLAI